MTKSINISTEPTKCHFCDPYSYGMLPLLQKYCGYHKSVARTTVRHRVAHYVLLANPPRAREDPELRLSDWNRIPFRRSAFLGFFATNTALSSSRSLLLARYRPFVLLMRSSGNEGTCGGTERGWAIHEGTKTTKWRSKEVKKWARMDNGLAQSVTRKSRWERIICKSAGAPSSSSSSVALVVLRQPLPAFLPSQDIYGVGSTFLHSNRMSLDDSCTSSKCWTRYTADFRISAMWKNQGWQEKFSRWKKPR